MLIVLDVLDLPDVTPSDLSDNSKFTVSQGASLPRERVKTTPFAMRFWTFFLDEHLVVSIAVRVARQDVLNRFLD